RTRPWGRPGRTRSGRTPRRGCPSRRGRRGGGKASNSDRGRPRSTRPAAPPTTPWTTPGGRRSSQASRWARRRRRGSGACSCRTPAPAGRAGENGVALVAHPLADVTTVRGVLGALARDVRPHLLLAGPAVSLHERGHLGTAAHPPGGRVGVASRHDAVDGDAGFLALREIGLARLQTWALGTRQDGRLVAELHALSGLLMPASIPQIRGTRRRDVLRQPAHTDRRCRSPTHADPRGGFALITVTVADVPVSRRTPSTTRWAASSSDRGGSEESAGTTFGR